MRSALLFLAVPFVALPAIAQQPQSAQQPQEPTAQELYEACVDLIDGPSAPTYSVHDADRCAWIAVFTLMEHALLPGDPPFADGRRAFCPPADDTISIESIGPLVEGYLERFRATGGEFAARPGRDAFLEAMVLRWPCGGKR
jgi:hypothetical protein